MLEDKVVPGDNRAAPKDKEDRLEGSRNKQQPQEVVKIWITIFRTALVNEKFVDYMIVD